MESNDRGGGLLAPGVREIEHTADVGIVVEAESLRDLLERTAKGVFALMYGEGDADLGPQDTFAPVEAAPPSPPVADESAEARRDGPAVPEDPSNEGDRVVSVDGDNPADLLLLWLRELLFIHETSGLSFVSVDFDELDHSHLRGSVRLHRRPTPPAMEFKGVTYHDLEVTEQDGVWGAQLILDV